MSISALIQVIVWVLIPTMNFFLWREFGRQSVRRCSNYQFSGTVHNAPSIKYDCPIEEGCVSLDRNRYPHIELMNSVAFDEARAENLVVDVSYVSINKNTVIVHRDKSEDCTSYISHTSGVIASKFCFSVVYYGNSYRQSPVHTDVVTDRSQPASGSFNLKTETQGFLGDKFELKTLYSDHILNVTTQSRFLSPSEGNLLSSTSLTGSRYLDTQRTGHDLMKTYYDYDLCYTYNLVRFDLNIDEAGQVIEPDYNYKVLAKLQSKVQSTIIQLKDNILGPALKLNKYNIGMH
jgi:hypothetical protein